MKTTLLSLILSALAVCAAIPLFLFSTGLEMNSPGSGVAFVQVAAWVTLGLIAQPVLVVPFVMIRALVGAGARLIKSN